MTPTLPTLPAVDAPPFAHRSGCGFCDSLAAIAAASAPAQRLQPMSPGRRLFGRALAGGAIAAATLPAWGQREGVEVGKQSQFAKLVPAEQIEQAADQQYRQILKQAAQQKALGPDDHPQVQRLRYISKRIIPFSEGWNPRAKNWRWEVNLIGSKEINAFCMPGGKIAFFHGILAQLQLDDDEVAMIMGHEAAHALREHARERMGKTAATGIVANLASMLFGLGSAGDALLQMGSQLLTLKFSREDETEADLVGMELAARSGYNPRAGVSLWQKMAEAAKGAPPQFLSTHPASDTRIRDIEANLPKVRPLYERAPRPGQQFAPPAKPAPAAR